jgi:hypothetical protein
MHCDLRWTKLFLEIGVHASSQPGFELSFEVSSELWFVFFGQAANAILLW